MKYGEDMKALMLSKRNFLSAVGLLEFASSPLGFVTSVDDAFSQVRRLDGIYLANDGSQLLVESVLVDQMKS
jgi:hypothetical protein